MRMVVKVNCLLILNFFLFVEIVLLLVLEFIEYVCCLYLCKIFSNKKLKIRIVMSGKFIFK